jgi:hypothetical protein
MNSIIKWIAWIALLGAAGCATPRNQGGTSDTPAGSQDMGSSVAPATPGSQPETQPRGTPENGSFMNDNGLDTDMLDEEEDWDDSNAVSEDQEMEEDDWSGPSESDISDLDNSWWLSEDSDGSVSESAEDSSMENSDESVGGDEIESQTDTTEDSGTMDAPPDNPDDSDSESTDELPDLISV